MNLKKAKECADGSFTFESSKDHDVWAGKSLCCDAQQHSRQDKDCSGRIGSCFSSYGTVLPHNSRLDCTRVSVDLLLRPMIVRREGWRDTARIRRLDRITEKDRLGSRIPGRSYSYLFIPSSRHHPIYKFWALNLKT